MKHVLVVAFCFASFISVAQVAFEPGYVIDLKGAKTICLIRNNDWYYNPSKILYKLTPEAKATSMNANDISEFVVGNLRFVRKKVRMDMSTNDTRFLTITRDPKWEDHDLLLRILAEGKATLYSWHQSDMERYFFSVDDGAVEQLIYKTFTMQGHAQYNKTYQVQLNALTCPGFSMPPSKLTYDRSSMETFFEAYNRCAGSVFVDRHTHYKGEMHIKITPGYEFSTLSLLTYSGDYDNSTYKKKNFRLGVEFEFVLPVNKNKWTAMIEPTYQQFVSSDGPSAYRSIETPIGVRRLFFLNDNSEIFLDGGLLVDMIFSAKSVSGKKATVTTSGFTFAPFAGLGYGHKKFSIEVRDYVQRTRLAHSDKIEVQYNWVYQKYSVILGWRIK